MEEKQSGVVLCNDEIEHLIDLLAGVRTAIDSNKLWFNKNCREYNQQFIIFIDHITNKLKNIIYEDVQ